MYFTGCPAGLQRRSDKFGGVPGTWQQGFPVSNSWYANMSYNSNYRARWPAAARPNVTQKKEGRQPRRWCCSAQTFGVLAVEIGKGTDPILGGHTDSGQGLGENLWRETSAAFPVRLKDKHLEPLQFIVARRCRRTLVRSRAQALLRDSPTGSSHNPNAHAAVSLVQFPNSMPSTSSSSTDSARATIVVPSRFTLV